MAKPTDEQWSALFAAFEGFCYCQPWRWLADTDVVAIEHPLTGEMGYCVVMGNAGIEFGFALHKGEAGLLTYLGLMTGKIDLDSPESVIEASVISAMIGGREDLDPRDRAVLRRMGYRINRKDVYPLFRSVEPGFAPWYIDDGEAQFLTVALANMVDVAMRIVEEKVDLYGGDEPGELLTRVFREGQWQDEWRVLKPPSMAPVPDYPDMERLDLLVQRLRKAETTWEFCVFRIPVAIEEKKGDRPYLPMGAIVVEGTSGFVLDMKVLAHAPSPVQRQDVLVEALENTGVLPASLVVDSTRTARLVESVTRRLGLGLSVGATPAAEEAMEFMLDHI